MVKENEEKYYGFFRTSRDCVFITSTDGRWIDLNDAAVELFGYSRREELMQVKIPDLYVNQEERLKHMSIIAECGYVKEFPVDLRRKDGSVRHTLITSVARYDAEGNTIGFQGTIRDITERKQIEDLYKTLTENSLAAIFIISDGKFRFINNSAIAYAGYSAKELIGQDSDLLVHPEDKEMAKRKGHSILVDGKIMPYEFRIITKQGQIRWITQIVCPIQYEGKPAILGNAIDITDRKRLEEEIEQLTTRC